MSIYNGRQTANAKAIYSKGHLNSSKMYKIKVVV